jgi:hypothetical protein
LTALVDSVITLAPADPIPEVFSDPSRGVNADSCVGFCQSPDGDTDGTMDAP